LVLIYQEENQKLIDEKYRNLVRLLEGARKARDTAQQQIVLRTKSLEEAHRSADQAIDQVCAALQKYLDFLIQLNSFMCSFCVQITTFAYEIEYVKTLNPTPDDFLDQVLDISFFSSVFLSVSVKNSFFVALFRSLLEKLRLLKAIHVARLWRVARWRLDAALTRSR
jgi:hypothetical protein